MKRIAFALIDTLFFVDIVLALIIPIAAAVQWLVGICM